jgi:hypothetical protein
VPCGVWGEQAKSGIFLRRRARFFCLFWPGWADGGWLRAAGGMQVLAMLQ